MNEFFASRYREQKLAVQLISCGVQQSLHSLVPLCWEEGEAAGSPQQFVLPATSTFDSTPPLMKVFQGHKIWVKVVYVLSARAAEIGSYFLVGTSQGVLRRPSLLLSPNISLLEEKKPLIGGARCPTSSTAASNG